MDCHKKGGAVAALPDDPLVEILSRVPIKSLCRFKCVSKAWRDLITDPLHRRKLPQTLEGFFCSELRDGDEVGGSDDDGGGDGGDGDGGGGSSSNGVPDYGDGHFIDLVGRSVPLVDPSFSFLRELPGPGMEHITILHFCNGLLLLRRDTSPYAVGRDTLGYVVCNPATEEWVAVPSSGWYVDPQEESDEEDNDREVSEHTFLMFDPAVSSHFKIVQFLHKDSIEKEVGLRTYASETGLWTDRSGERRRLGEEGENQQLGSFGSIASTLGCAFVNGMLHLIVDHIQNERELIVAVDWEGKTRSVISCPQSHSCLWSEPIHVGQSQGRLYCISEDLEGDSAQITIWVLEDYDKQEWVMKHSVSSLQLFGTNRWLVQFDYSVVTIHPDRNLVFIAQRDRRLICYDMDSKEVHALCMLGHGYLIITPYVPYFSETSVLSNKH